MSARYEYRRRILARTLPDRLDAGIGIQALGDLLAMSRHLPPSIESGEREGRVGFAGVAAARVRVSRRLTIEGAWINGLRLARLQTRHETDATESVNLWGGGWLTDTRARADLRVAPRASIAIEYARTGEGTAAHFHSYAAATDRVALARRSVHVRGVVLHFTVAVKTSSITPRPRPQAGSPARSWLRLLSVQIGCTTPPNAAMPS
jgi:hypothetical protein